MVRIVPVLVGLALLGDALGAAVKPKATTAAKPKTTAVAKPSTSAKATSPASVSSKPATSSSAAGTVKASSSAASKKTSSLAATRQTKPTSAPVPTNSKPVTGTASVSGSKSAGTASPSVSKSGSGSSSRTATGAATGTVATGTASASGSKSAGTVSASVSKSASGSTSGTATGTSRSSSASASTSACVLQNKKNNNKPAVRRRADTPTGSRPGTPDPNASGSQCPSNSGGIPIFEIDCDKTKEICSNICFAVNCKGKSLTLTKSASSTGEDSKRQAAGCITAGMSGSGFGPCGKNWNGKDDFTGGMRMHYTRSSCDEFPFNSSNEGGAGAVLRCVPAKENSSQGGMISSFYKKYATELEASGGKYTIKLKNEANIKHCNKAAADNCTNDPKAIFSLTGTEEKDGKTFYKYAFF